MKPRQLAIIITVSVLVVGAIALGVSQRSDSSLGSKATRAASDEIQANAAAPAAGGKQPGLPSFEGTTFSGDALASSDITGPAVIHVFASWCPTCQSEAPAFAQLQRKHPELNYYFIAVEDEGDAATKFAEQYGWKPGPTFDDSDRSIEGALQLSGQPHTIFVAANGAITTHKGPGSFGDLDMLARAIA